MILLLDYSEIIKTTLGENDLSMWLTGLKEKTNIALTSYTQNNEQQYLPEIF